MSPLFTKATKTPTQKVNNIYGNSFRNDNSKLRPLILNIIVIYNIKITSCRVTCGDFTTMNLQNYVGKT